MFFSYYDNTSSKTPKSYLIWELQDIITSKELKSTTELIRRKIDNVIQTLPIDKVQDAVDNLKASQPIITPSAIMNEGCKEKWNTKNHSGIFFLDIDLKDNPDFKNKLEFINADQYTYFSSHSLNGGVHIVVYTNCNDINQHKAYWTAIKNHYETKFKIKIDPRPSAISSFCFMTYDPSPYVNPFSKVFKLNKNDYDLYKNKLNTIQVVVDLENNTPKKSSIVKLSKEDKDTLKQPVTPLVYRYQYDEDKIVDKQKPVYVKGGIDVCDIWFNKDYLIEDGYRHQTLGKYANALLFNNPDVELKRLIQEVYMINKRHCKPILKPKSVADICKYAYGQHKRNELNVEPIIRRKYVFYSKEYITELTPEQEEILSRIEIVEDYKIARKEMLRKNKTKTTYLTKTMELEKQYEETIYNAIEDLRLNYNGKIKYKALADKLSIGISTLNKYLTPELRTLLKM